METYKSNKGYILKVQYDECAGDGILGDTLGTIYHCHSRYNIGASDFESVNIRNWSELDIRELKKESIWLPIYMYDHSGICLNTTGFSCPWDSGQVGYIVVKKDKVRKEYGWKNITADRKKLIEGVLTGEIESLSAIYEGNVWYGEVFDSEGNSVDSIGGVIGDDYLVYFNDIFNQYGSFE